MFSVPGDESAEVARAAVTELLVQQNGATGGDLASHLLGRSGEEAVHHIFRVASSLDSMVPGEAQILGQVKCAYEMASAAGTVGSELGPCLTRAFKVAKRVRTETHLGSGTVSVSSVAVDLATRVFGDLDERTVLLLGAGEMAEAAARSLGKGARHVRVCNRSFERAASLASAIGGEAAPWQALPDELVRADVVVASTGSRSYVVTLDMVKQAIKARRGRSLLLLDIAVPRNVDPVIHKLDNVYVFNVDDLEQEVAAGLSARMAEAEAAEKIVLDEVREFAAWRRGLTVAPAIVALRSRTIETLAAELDLALSGPLKHLGEADRAALRVMLDSATAKLLHRPITRLRAQASAPDGADVVRAVTEVFDLPPPSEGASPKSGRGGGERASDGAPSGHPPQRG
jgi:glutamyl-tRNA reductase